MNRNVQVLDVSLVGLDSQILSSKNAIVFTRLPFICSGNLRRQSDQRFCLPANQLQTLAPGSMFFRVLCYKAIKLALFFKSIVLAYSFLGTLSKLTYTSWVLNTH